MSPEAEDGRGASTSGFESMTSSGLRRSVVSHVKSLMEQIAFEDDEAQPALGADPALVLVEGKGTFNTGKSGIFEESAAKRLRQTLRSDVVTSSSGRVFQLVLFVLCAICGSMIPLITQFTKDVSPSCQGPDCTPGLQYVAGTAVIAENLSSLSVGFAITFALSGEAGLWQCLNPVRLKMTAPIAFFYVTGDVVQMMAIGKTDAALFLVVGQIKLLATALIALLILRAQQSTAQWFLLGAITIAAALYCDLELHLVKKKGRGDMEIPGLMLSLFKVALASVNAVLTERAFKASGSEPIWVNQVQLKICALPCALVVVFVKNIMLCDGASIQSSCLFSDRSFFEGWSYKVFVLLLAQVFNNYVLGLVYKNVNAVVKYLAYAQSLWVTYLFNIVISGEEFNLDLLLVIFILVFMVIAYSFAKVAPPPKAPEAEVAPTSGNVEMGESLCSNENRQRAS